MIKNIRNNFIDSGFVTLVIIVAIALGAIILSPLSAHAEALSGYNVTYGDKNVDNNSNRNESPVPFVTSINPSSVYVNSGPKTLTVYGGNFVRGSVVRLNGSNRSTNYINSTELTTELYSSDTANISTNSVVVWNPGPGGGNSNPAYLSVKALPVVTGSVKGASTSRVVTKKTPAVAETKACNCSETANDYGALASNAVFGSNSFLPTGIMQWLLLAILILLIVIITRKIFVGDNERNKPLKHA